MTRVHNCTAYDVHFVAIPGTRAAYQLQAVREFLNQAAAHFAKKLGADQPKQVLRLEDFDEDYFDPLTRVEPVRAASGAVLQLDAWTMHDAVMLRTTAEHKPPIELAKVKELDFSTPLPRPPEGLAGYLGAFRVLLVETENADQPRWSEVAKALAMEFQRPWLIGAKPIRTRIGTMLFGVPPQKTNQGVGAPTLDLVFVGGRESAGLCEKHHPHPFLFTLPELALCHLKVRNSVENLRLNWLQQLAQRERELHDLLPARGEEERDLLKMLDQNDDLTARQAELVDAIAHVQLELRTMRINRENFAAAAASFPFRRVAPRLQHLLIDRWIRRAEPQAENDLGYIQGTLQRAENHFKSIEASAAAYQGRELRQINRKLIWLSVAQLLVAVVATVLALLPLLTSSSSSAPPAPNAAAKQP